MHDSWYFLQTLCWCRWHISASPHAVPLFTLKKIPSGVIAKVLGSSCCSDLLAPVLITWCTWKSALLSFIIICWFNVANPTTAPEKWLMNNIPEHKMLTVAHVLYTWWDMHIHDQNPFIHNKAHTKNILCILLMNLKKTPKKTCMHTHIHKTYSTVHVVLQSVKSHIY